MENKEDYDKSKSVLNQDLFFQDINFCSNYVYKTIITVILSLIIIYFIWFLCRKKYKENYTDIIETSTPFE